MTAASARLPGNAPYRQLASAAYPVALLLCAVLSLTALAAGATGWAGVWDPAAAGDPRAREILTAALSGWPTWQGALDYALSALAIAVAGALAAGRDRSWATRLLVLAMIGSAGAFNMHAHAVATAVEAAIGLRLGAVHQVLFPGVVVAAYLLALLVFPPEREPHGARTGLLVAGTGTLLLAGLGAAVLPLTVSCAVFLGFLGPVVGVLVLPRQIRGAPTPTARTQARLLFSVAAVTAAIVTVLVTITALMWMTGWGDLLLLSDPTAVGTPGAGQPTALLYWFARLAGVAIAGAVFVATRQGDLWNAERLFSRGLAAGLTAALLGGGYVVVRNSAGLLVEGVLPAVITTVLAALALRPAYVRAERWTDRLFFGTRPTPYSVLAGITALSRASATDAPDLARVAEAVGRGLGAATCRLTVTRPGLGRRSYTWRAGEAHDPDELVEVVVHHGAEAVGTLAVDYAAVAGLQRQRQHLLEDVADSLGVVLQASRYGIELERQLRAALAHAGEIAASRRAVVAEMDAERRRIERDLHDGAQHHLVSLRLTLGLVEHQVSTRQLDKARRRLDQVADQIDMAESILAETAIGVSSPLLAEMGLVRALEKELASGQPPVAVEASGAEVEDRFSHDVESAVYFCCLEAVNNARKHAEGATVTVRLHAEDGRLRFTVQDDGPGWDQSRRTGTPGRGLRNVTTRISAVGGRLEVRSSPGQGTTVDGSVPLRTGSVPSVSQPSVSLPSVSQPSSSQPAAAPTGTAPPKSDLPAQAALSLPDQVRDAVREARERYHGTGHSDVLRVLAERLDAPLGLAVTGDGEGAAALAAALAGPDADGVPGVGGAVLVPAESHADAFLVVLRRAADGEVLLPDRPGVAAGHRPAHAIGALLVDGPVDAPAQRAAADCTARREVRRLCHVVVPVAPGFARAAAVLSDEQHRVLLARAECDGDGQAVAPTLTVAVAGAGGRAPSAARTEADGHQPERPLPFDKAVVRFAVAEIRSGAAPTREALAAALVRVSGLTRLRDLVCERLTRRAAALTSRAVLLAVEDLVRREPPPVGGEGLRYRLDRIRSGAFELTELDVVDALRAGELDLPEGERRSAERLLGAAGTDPRARLGLAPDAPQQDVVRVAAEQLARWHRHAVNPLSGVDLRRTADVLVRACERLIVSVA